MSAYQYIVIVRPSNCTDALETSNRISAALSKSPEKRWVNISFNERTDVWQTGEKSGSLGFIPSCAEADSDLGFPNGGKSDSMLFFIWRT
jgi:hypothetical protein